VPGFKLSTKEKSIMRCFFACALVGMLVGCTDAVSKKTDEHAKSLDPVVRQTPAASDSAAKPASGNATEAPMGNKPAGGGGGESTTGGDSMVAQRNNDAAGNQATAASAPRSPLDRIIDKYVDSGIDGVVDVTTDSNGGITKVVIVGAAPISTVLGAADGLLTARREARLRAAGKFRQFLKEKVSIEEKTETERVVKLETGEKGGDLTESGKKISKNTEKYQTVSEGMVKGLQVLGYKTVSLNPKEKVYVMICGWDAATSKAVSGLAKDLDSDDATGGDKGADSKERRTLPDQQGVAPGADKFFGNDKKPPF
jgi:hypothetical protein